MLFDATIERLRSIQDDFPALILRLVRLNEAFVVSLNVDRQLYEQGVDGNGDFVAPPYRPSTIRRKIRKGQPTNRVTLKDKGDFHGSFYLIFREGEFEISAKDPKRERLVRKYGKPIFGLTEESLDLLRERLKVELIQETRKAILGQ